MKLFIDQLFTVVYILEFFGAVNSSQSFLYEKLNHFGLGRRIIPSYHRPMSLWNEHEHPAPLPSPSPSPLRFSSQSIYQGRRRRNDTRVFRRQFDFTASDVGHHMFCEGMFDCIITYLAAETEGGIPILMRGGVGYQYFIVVVKAKPGVPLKGTVRAYCMDKTL